jgi:glyoxylase-like metal-dependent hydrolase (beta-lactamase superfamily II)
MSSSNVRLEKLVVGPLLSNCFLVWDDDSKKGVIVDPGDEGHVILERVKGLGIEVECILATHGHFDHVAGTAPLKNALDADFLAHKDDMFFIDEGKRIARDWGFDIEQPSKPDRFIKDGDKIDVGSFILEVLYTPGHSPGGVSFLGQGMLFSGDTLFQGSIGRTDFRGGSMEELEKSIKTRLYVLPDDTIVYTGHGPRTTIGEEKSNNPFVRAQDE